MGSIPRCQGPPSAKGYKQKGLHVSQDGTGAITPRTRAQTVSSRGVVKVPTNADKTVARNFRHSEIAGFVGKTADNCRQFWKGAYNRKLLLILIDRYVLSALSAFLQHPIPLATPSHLVLSAPPQRMPTRCRQCRQNTILASGPTACSSALEPVGWQTDLRPAFICAVLCLHHPTRFARRRKSMGVTRNPRSVS